MEKEKKEIDLLRLASMVWRERRRFIKWGFVGGVIGLVISLSIPRAYTSEATIAPEEQSTSMSGSMGMLSSMMGVVGSSRAGVNATLYPEVIKSRDFLLEFADIEVKNDGVTMPLSEYLLEGQKRAWWSYIFGLPGLAMKLFRSSDDSDSLIFEASPRMQSNFLKRMSESLAVSRNTKTGVFVMSSTFQDPLISKLVLDSVLVKLQSYMDSYQTAKTRATLRSNIAMMDEAKDQYHTLDVEYARAVDRNRITTSSESLVYADRLKTERDLAAQVYKQVAAQVSATELKLQEQQPIMTVINAPVEPLDSSAPNKPMICIMFAFLGGVVCFGRMLVREFRSM